MRRSIPHLPLFALALVLLACPDADMSEPDPHPTEPAGTGPRVAAALDFDPEPEQDGLKVRLSDAEDRPAGGDGLALPEARPLPASEARALLARLPELEEDPRPGFALRERSQPPPRPGATIEEAFPPPPGAPPPAVADGPLTVRRFAPEGEVPMAPQLSVTFSAPMVAVTSQEEAAAVQPVRLQPQPAGAWRWVGTKTILFDPDRRFPMATEYTVTVPAGTKSANGDPLAEEHRFTFATPPVMLRSMSPSGGPLHLEPVFVLEFDQAVDPTAVLPHLSLAGPSAPPLRLATEAEIEADEAARERVRAAKADARGERLVVVRADGPLPKASSWTLRVARGTPSAEGPRLTTANQGEGLATYGPLRIEEHGCSWGEECPPESPFWVRFNNPLDEASVDALFAAGAFSVEPAMGGLSVVPQGQALMIQGVKKARTTYKVTVPGALRDGFGQTLGGDRTLSFKVGAAQERLQGPAGQVVVLDPAGETVFPVYSAGHRSLRVQIQRVGPEDWAKLGDWQNEYWRNRLAERPLPGTRLVDETVRVQGDPDELTQTRVDLRPHLQGDHGQFIVRVVPTVQPREEWRRTMGVIAWVQVTDIGLSAFSDELGLLAWATSLQDGAPLEGVEVAFAPADGVQPALTRADGTATLGLPVSRADQHSQLLVARKGGDLAILSGNGSFWRGTTWIRNERGDSLAWLVFDDRGLYKPGETVRVKGFVRRVEPGPRGDVQALSGRDGRAGAPRAVAWKLWGPQGNEVAAGEAALSAHGGFDLSIELPGTVNLGSANLELNALGGSGLGGTSHYRPVQIQEFRRPEFEVKASADPGPHLLGERAVVDVEAAYFAGGGLPGAEVTWRLYASPGQYSPPGWEDFSFGSWVPWWVRGGGEEWMPWMPPPAALAEHAGKTDGGGVHRLAVDFLSLRPPRPMSVRAEATVMDVNRQAWTAKHTMLLHPAAEYVGLKTDRGFYEKGRKVRVDAVAVGIDGGAVVGRAVEVSLARLVWKRQGGQWKEVEDERLDCAVRSAAEPVRCEFEPAEGGSWRLRARIVDEAGRPTESERRLWIAGGEGPPSRGVEKQDVELIPSAETFAAGEVAELLVRAPFAPSEGVVTWRRDGLAHSERITLSGSTTTIRVPIEEGHVPNLHVQVDLSGEVARTDDAGEPRPDAPKRPAFASGTIDLKVPPANRTLGVELRPAEPEVEPGSEVAVDLVLKDASGAAVPEAEVALWIVDEAVLSLTGYRNPDPLSIFYAARGAGVRDHHLRSFLLLSDPDLLGDASGDAGMVPEATTGAAAPMLRARRSEGAADMMMEAKSMPAAAPPMEIAEAEMDADGAVFGGEQQQAAPDGPAIALRKDFSALALFEPAVRPDAQGRARLTVKLPDSLTRWRVLAVAVAGGQDFGTAEAAITARKPLMLRPSPPRFLNFGDRFELPVVLQNQTDEALTAKVAVRSNGFFLSGDFGKQVVVPAQDRVEVRFPAEARDVGTARWQVAVASRALGRDFSDGTQGELPIWTPATTEAFATYGEIDAGAIKQPVAAPTDVWTQFGGLEITTSSTALQALTDAVIYLVDYPYGCSEQIASRILAIASLRDVLDAFDAEGLPDADALVAAVQADIEEVLTRQSWDGSFGFWRRGDSRTKWPYLTVHVMHALARAEQKGFSVPADGRQRGLGYLRDIRNHIPSDYSKESKWAIRAYALYVRELLGDAGGPAAQALLREAGLDGLSLEGLGWILPTLHAAGDGGSVDSILRKFDNAAVETAATAQFTSSYSDGAHVLLHSARRTDGIVLDALIRVKPDHDLVAKTVRGLLGHKKKGRWGNTQENAFVLLALDRYFRVYEAETPDFVARAWLGQGYAGEHRFKGRTTEYSRISVPMATMAAGDGKHDLVLQKDGAGRMYYRIGMSYAPKSLRLEPADYGFAVERVYEAVDDDADVSRGEDGTWTIRAGSRVRVRVTMAAEARRYHVALVDPLPAGLEAINPELATSETLPQAEGTPSTGRGWWWWWGPWYEHDNLRDERAEAFTSLLWDGVFEYTYLARATTPGEFVVPPPKAEEMYHPETFGRGATDRVVVR